MNRGRIHFTTAKKDAVLKRSANYTVYNRYEVFKNLSIFETFRQIFLVTYNHAFKRYPGTSWYFFRYAFAGFLSKHSPYLDHKGPHLPPPASPRSCRGLLLPPTAALSSSPDIYMNIFIKYDIYNI
jgi:hypothetical protein